jgi:hypothetical protein
MDLGKVSIKIPADAMPFGDAELVADAIAAALSKGYLGEVLSVAKLRYEPFTPDIPEHGRTWNQVDIMLDKVISLSRLKELLLASGVPDSAHLTYADQMRMCGESLGRV